jgi:hypothetical protein
MKIKNKNTCSIHKNFTGEFCPVCMAEEEDKLQKRYDVAMNTLRQIATTPRNRGAQRNASATVAFLESIP